MGHQSSLYVEVQPIGSGDEVKQTTTGVRLREGKDGERREELWSWRAGSMKKCVEVPEGVFCAGKSHSRSARDHRPPLGGPDRQVSREVAPPRSGQLIFEGLKALEFTLRVLGSYMTWHMALALHMPLEPLGEARFRVTDGDLGSDIYVPIQWEGRVCGYVMMIINVHHGKASWDREREREREPREVDFDEEADELIYPKSGKGYEL